MAGDGKARLAWSITNGTLYSPRAAHFRQWPFKMAIHGAVTGRLASPDLIAGSAFAYQ
jgi:hypothetical protein